MLESYGSNSWSSWWFRVSAFAMWSLLWCSFIYLSLDYSIICLYIIYGCNHCVESNIWRGYMIRYSRFWVSVPDRYRHDSDRIVPFPISRITDFVFPTEISRSYSRFRIKIWKRKWLGSFPDRSRPFSSLVARCDDRMKLSGTSWNFPKVHISLCHVNLLDDVRF